MKILTLQCINEECEWNLFLEEHLYHNTFASFKTLQKQQVKFSCPQCLGKLELHDPLNKSCKCGCRHSDITKNKK